MADFANGGGNGGRRIISSDQFVNASRIFSILGAVTAAVVAGLLIYDLQLGAAQRDKLDAAIGHIEQIQGAQSTQVAVMAQTQSAQADQLRTNRDRLERVTEDLSETRDRVLCLEHKSTCAPR